MKPLDFQTYCQLQSAFGNYEGNVSIGGQSFPVSNIELSKPTGKYVARAILKLATALSAKGFVQFAGNACSPGLQFPKLDSVDLSKDFNNNCGIFIFNALGSPEVQNTIILPAEPFMNLPIQPQWDSFNDYLDAMSSKYRVRTKKALSTSQEYQKVELKNHQASEWIPQCAQLLGHTLKDKTLAISPKLSNMLHTFVRTTQQQFKVWGYYKHEQLCGFITCIKSEHGLYAMHLGLTDAAADEQLYQRMMYDMIDYAIVNKDEFVCLGRTATEIKSTMGAVPVENSYVFYAKSKILRFILKFYKNRFYKPKTYQIRSPFK